jgi:TonB family protein
MLYQTTCLQDLAAYSLQVASIVIAGSLIVLLLRLHIPKIRLVFWQALLAACLLLPMIQPWRSQWMSGGPLSTISQIKLTGGASPLVSWPVASLVLAVMCGGILFRLLWTALGLHKLRVYRMRACPLYRETASILEARALTGVRIALYVSAEIGSPATFGLASPAVLLPHRLFELPAAQQRAVVCHEFLHVSRHDWAWTLAEELVLTLLWFHPAVWWVIRNIRLSREQDVDSAVIRLTSSRHEYVKALLDLAHHQTASIIAPLFLGESQLVKRVTLIAKEIKMSRFRLVSSLLAAFAVLFLTGVAAVKSFPLYARPGAATPLFSTGQPATPSPDNFTLAAIHGKIYKVGKNVKPPRPIRGHSSFPSYTLQAKHARLEGTVRLSIVVDAEGNVDEVKEISKPLGLGLDESAMRAVRTWKFVPAQRKGKPVAVRVTVETTFRLF